MLKKLVVILACTAMMQGAAQAQFIKSLPQVDTRDQQVVAGLSATMADVGFSKLRGGGSSGKPIGQYLVDPSFEFKSDYKNVPADLQCKFAYDLHELVKAQGRDWPAMQRNGGLNYLPYDKQREFSEFWWRRNYEPMKHMGIFFIDGFLSDAIADATNIYNYYYRQAHGSADYVMWQDAALQQVVKKK
jgi:hypothetical protein